MLQGVDVTRRIVECGNRLGNIVRTDLAVLEVLPKPGHEARMGLCALLAKIGQRTGMPEAFNRGWG